MFKVSFTLSVLISSFLINTAAFAAEKDPTKPLTKTVIDAESAQQHLVLKSIMKTSNTRKAIINNKTVKLGDRIGEFTVIDIKKRSVTLQNNEETIELSLFNQALIK